MPTQPPVIPTKFIRLDDRTSTTNHFINVADLRKSYENHNILIARRLKRNVLTMGNTFTIRGGVPLSDNFPAPPALEIPIKLSAEVSQLDLNFYGRRAGVVNSFLYFSVDGPNGARPLDESQKITVSATSNTLHSLSLKVPNQAVTSGEGVLRVYCVTPIDPSTKVVSGGTIYNITANHVTVNDTTLSETDIGKYIRFGTFDSSAGTITPFTNMSPKMITQVSRLADVVGSLTRKMVQFVPSLEFLPSIADLGYDVIESGSIVSESISVYEKAIEPATGFYSERIL